MRKIAFLIALVLLCTAFCSCMNSHEATHPEDRLAERYYSKEGGALRFLFINKEDRIARIEAIPFESTHIFQGTYTVEGNKFVIHDEFNHYHDEQVEWVLEIQGENLLWHADETPMVAKRGYGDILFKPEDFESDSGT